MQRRRGTTLLETVACMALLVLLMAVLARISVMEMDEAEGIVVQYSALSADAFLADIYEDFRKSASCTIEETPEGQHLITFSLPGGTSTIYGWDSVSGMCLINGVEQFAAQDFAVLKAGTMLSVSIKVSGEELLEMTFYR